jgi:ribonuclease BN (tRNA processing enzyme)
MRRLLEAGFHYRDVDYLFYTHIHPDHTHDMVPFLFATKHTPGYTRTRPLCIVGPPGFKDFFSRVMDIYGEWVLSDGYDLEVAEMKEGMSRSFSGWEVSTRLLEHSVPSLAYRFTDGAAIAVIAGDTSYCRAIVEHSLGADLLVIECSFPSDLAVEGHLTPETTSRIARESGCKRLAITHMYPIVSAEGLAESCRRGYDGEVIPGRDLLRIQL